LKANQKFLNDRAEVGVGTLIVFIAMVLVAAVAAAVLINTTGSLQQRAQSTGKEATQEVSSNLKVINVYGDRGATTTDNIYIISVYAELSAGALPMDLSQLVIRYSDGTDSWNYAQANNQDNSTDPPLFELDCIRGDCSDTDTVMKSGDLAEFIFTLHDTTYMAPRLSVQLSLIPETGTPVSADFKTPATYGDDLTVTLR
jgi:flagellin FlaB